MCKNAVAGLPNGMRKTFSEETVVRLHQDVRTHLGDAEHSEGRCSTGEWSFFDISLLEDWAKSDGQRESNSDVQSR